MKGNISKQQLRYLITFVMLLILFLILAVCNMMIGNINMSVPELVKVLFSGKHSGSIHYDILWKIRLPRMMAAIILGGALALSGYLLQTFFNNPIAGPYVLGISSGAKLAVAIVLIAVLGSGKSAGSVVLIAAAFLGSMIVMGFVLMIARSGQSSAMLIISGVMVGYICSAVTEFIITFADDANIVNLHNWSRGSFSGTSWEQVRVMAVVVLAASVTAVFLSKSISACQLGENYARSMGVNIRRYRIVLVLLQSILCACVTAFAGPISFVGIAVPHLIKAFLGTSKPLLVIPGCFLGGAVFSLGCDLIARIMFAPTELSISAVTAVLGAPVVIVIMFKRKVR